MNSKNQSWSFLKETSSWTSVCFIVLLLSAMVGVFPDKADAAMPTLTVNTYVDRANGTACTGGATDCSLREAIMKANSMGGGTIVLPAGTFSLNLIGANEDDSKTGDLDIKSAITIIGSGGTSGSPSATVIDATSLNDRVFDVNPLLSLGFNVSFQGLTIQGGNLPDSSPYGGGGILADTGINTLSFENVVITGNKAKSTIMQHNGGGLFVSGLSGGVVKFLNSDISNNSSDSSGGGLFYEGSGRVDVNKTTFRTNNSGGLGGGIYLNSSLSMENSTISGNLASDMGGGIFIDNYTGGTSRILSSTIAYNQSSIKGSGIYANAGLTELQNTIVSANVTNDVSGSFSSSSDYNLIGIATEGFPTAHNKLNNTNPGLKPLSDNGGPTKTHALNADSPAIDMGNNAVTLQGQVDQRGFARIVDFNNDNVSTIDIGAYEASELIKPIANVSTFDDTPVTVDISLGVSADKINLVASSGDTNLLPNANLSLVPGIDAMHKKLNITPIKGKTGTVTVTLTATQTIGGQVITETKSFNVTINGQPDLEISQVTAGDFKQGGSGTIQLTVKNVGSGPTSGTVTVKDTLPAGLTATAITGTGWTCDPGTLTCTRTTPLAAGGTYPVITISVNIDKNASNVSNSAEVILTGDKNTANNATTMNIPIAAIADLKVNASTAGTLSQGQAGSYNIQVINAGDAPSSGPVSVKLDVPVGLTVTDLSGGTDWSCDKNTLTCQTNNPIPIGTTFTSIALKVQVAEDAKSPVTLNVIVTSGNDKDPTNNTFTLSTNINKMPIATNDNKTTLQNTLVSGSINATDPDLDTLVYSIKSAPTHGTAKIVDMLKGTWEYTPDLGYVGSDSFTVSIIDGKGAEKVVTIFINVENQAPVLDNVSATTTQTTTTGGKLAATDLDHDILKYSKNSDPTHGVATVQTDGSWTYVPNAGFVGTDTFEVKVDDQKGGIATATVTITVNNIAPTAANGSFTTEQKIAITKTVTASDAGGDTLTYAYSKSAHGTLTSNNADWTYTPDAGYVGPDEFTVTVTDPYGGTTKATISLTVTNIVPTVTNQSVTTKQKQAVSGQLIGTDAGGDSLTYALKTQATNGTATVSPDGSWVYTPKAGFAGKDTFEAKVDDQNGGTASATITITVDNIAPTVEAGSYTTEQKTAITKTVTAADAGDDALTYAYSKPAHGTLTSKNADWTYTPDAGFAGSDTFTVTVTDSHGAATDAKMNITVTNLLPTTKDQSASTTQKQAVSGKLVSADAGGDTLVYTVQTSPTNGTATVGPDGSWTYTPKAGFAGQDTFTVKVDDQNGGTATATVTIAVNNIAPTVEAGSYTTEQKTAITKTVTASDAGGDTLTYEYSIPAHGKLTTNQADWTYTSDAGYVGPDEFTVTVKDANGAQATAKMSVTVTNIVPTIADQSVTTKQKQATSGQLIGVDAGGDSLTYTLKTQAANGTAAVSPDGSWTYTPKASFAGKDTFEVKVDDQKGGTATATITITVDNIAPTVEAGSYTTEQKTAITKTVTAADAGDDPITFTYSRPTNGMLTTKDAEWTYTPNAGFAGVDAFIVTVLDGYGGSSEARMSLNVTNIVPTVANQSVTTKQQQAANGQLIGADAGGDILTYALQTQAINGVATVGPNGSWTYTPKAGFAGKDTFDVKVDDQNGGTATASVTITVDNIAPTVAAGSYTTEQKTAITKTVSASDAGGDTLTYAYSKPAYGTLTSNNADWTYTPDAGYVGSDEFTVTVTDPYGAQATAKISLTVTNIVPTIADQSVTTKQKQATSGKLIGVDAGGDSLTYTLKTQATNGTATVSPDGSWTYTPKDGFAGSDSFIAEVKDTHGDVATATISITVDNLTPTVTNDTVQTEQKKVVKGKISGNDLGGDSLTYTIDEEASNGTVTLLPSGEWSYVSKDGFAGEDHFKVKVNDGNGGEAVATVTVTVQNIVPVIQDDTSSTIMNQAVSGKVKATDVGKDALTYVKLTDPAHGKVTVDADGSWNYTPNNSFVGQDTFTIQVDDGHGGKATGTISIAVNYPPSSDSGSTPVPEKPVISDNSNNKVTAVEVSTGTLQIQNGQTISQHDISENIITQLLQQANNQKTDTVGIVIAPQQANVDLVNVHLNAGLMAKLADQVGTIILQYNQTQIQLSKETLIAMKNQDITFNLKHATKEQENETRGMIVKMVDGAQLVGQPIQIETNYSKTTQLLIPFQQSLLPTDSTDLNKYLSHLYVFIQHSDGELKIDKGHVKYNKDGKPVGLMIQVDKFSTFSIMSVPELNFDGTNFPDYTGVVPADKVWTVKFNTVIQSTSITNETVYILDQLNNKIKADISTSGKELKIKPSENLTAGVYYLYITKDVKSINGKSMKKTVRMKFEVK